MSTISNYLSKANYIQSSHNYTSYSDIFKDIKIGQAPQIIAIDGPTNSGKTTITAALTKHYANLGIKTAVISLDYFLISRDKRQRIFDDFESGKVTAATYSDRIWSQKNYRDCLIAARSIMSDNSIGREETVTIANAYNRNTGKRGTDLHIVLPRNGIVIVEGVGIHNRNTKFFDTFIWVDVNSCDTLLERAIKREANKPIKSSRLSKQYIKHRYHTVDVPHSNYLRNVTAGRADIVIDTTNFENMIVYNKANA